MNSEIVSVFQTTTSKNTSQKLTVKG